MGIFAKLWGRRPPPPPSPSPMPPMPAFAPKLVPAPVTIRPLPAFPDDPLTAEVAHLWTEFQRKKPNPTWDHFISDLEAKNRELAAANAKVERDRAALPPEFNR